MIEPKEKFMREAIEQARMAKQDGDYSMGAVLVVGDEIISAWGSRVKRDESPIAHAEVLAILDGAQKLKSRHLINAILYTTTEPCAMCSSSAIFARLKGIVFGATAQDMRQYAEKNEKGVYLWRTIDIPCQEVITRAHEDLEVVPNFMREDCVALFRL